MNKSFIMNNKKKMVVGTIIVLIILLCIVSGIVYVKYNNKQLLHERKENEKQNPTVKVNTSYLESENNGHEDLVEEDRNTLIDQKLQNSGGNNTVNNSKIKPNSNTPLNQTSTNDNTTNNGTSKPNDNISQSQDHINDNINNNINKQEIVKATQEKYCAKSGYTLIGDSCVKINYSNVTYNVKCSTGYSLVTNEQGKQVCRPTGYQEEKAPSPSKTFTCDGGTEEDLFVNSKHYWDCHHGTLRTIWSCPTNYVVADYYQKDSMGHMVQMLYCKYNGPTQDTDVIKVCTAEYPTIDETSGKCINKVTDRVSVKYVCPSGYTLNGDKCYK